MVLIISQKLKNAVSLSDIFYYMKVLSYPCTPSQALSEISTLYNAILIMEPNDLPDTADFVKKLRSIAPIPVFAIANEPKKCRCPYVFDKLFPYAILSGNLGMQMLAYLKENKYPLFGMYVYMGLDVRCGTRIPTYYLNDIDITKTERMILCYLAHANHEQQPPKNILKYAFPYNRKPSVSCVQTHISKINAKFRKMINKNIVGCNPGTGYYLYTPLNRTVKLRKKDKTSHIV